LIDERHPNQSAQSGEDDAHKSDQVDQSSQPSATEDSAISEDTSQSIHPEYPQEVGGHVVSVTNDEFDEVCLLPEKTQEDAFDIGDSLG
jgi:hypothetical protein